MCLIRDQIKRLRAPHLLAHEHASIAAAAGRPSGLVRLYAVGSVLGSITFGTRGLCRSIVDRCPVTCRGPTDQIVRLARLLDFWGRIDHTICADVVRDVFVREVRPHNLGSSRRLLDRRTHELVSVFCCPASLAPDSSEAPAGPASPSRHRGLTETPIRGNSSCRPGRPAAPETLKGYANHDAFVPHRDTHTT